MENNNNDNNNRMYKYRKHFRNSQTIEMKYLKLLNKKTKDIESRVKEIKKLIKELFSVDVLIFPSKNSQTGIKKYSSDAFLKLIKRKVGIIQPRKMGFFETTYNTGNYFVRVPIEVTTKSYAINAGRRYYTDSQKIKELSEFFQKKYEKELSRNNSSNGDILSFTDQPMLYVKKSFRSQLFLVFPIHLNTKVGGSIITDNFKPMRVTIRSKRLSEGKNTNVVGQINAGLGKISKEIPDDLKKKKLYEKLNLSNNNNT